ncbi:MAG: hypothetical protein CK531_04980 [Gemmatimonadetes bacterium]|nr:MAG: hypothetical protein CK531_04980 [Gemmatimonadota bacterium]
MPRFARLQILMLAGVVVGACKPEEVVKTENIPTAGVRFINAVPDSAGAFGFDMRFLDLVENNAQFRITFRNGPATVSGVTASAQTQFKNARAGSRRFAIFLDDTLQSIAQVKLKDTTVTIEAGKNYTAILWGAARMGAMKLTFFEDVPADPGANVALRVINASSAAIDVRQYPQGGAVPATATWASVAPLSKSAFVNAAPGNIMYNVRAAGSATNLFADLLALQGQANTVDIEGTPGTTRAGSAVTLVVFPQSTVGARTPQAAAFLVPAGAFMWDRRPLRTSP